MCSNLFLIRERKIGYVIPSPHEVGGGYYLTLLSRSVRPISFNNFTNIQRIFLWDLVWRTKKQQLKFDFGVCSSKVKGHNSVGLLLKGVNVRVLYGR